MEGWEAGSWKAYLAKVAGIAAAYYGAAKLGLSLAFAAPSVTAIWPPTGIALTAILLWGYRVWPGIAAGAFLANSWTGVPLYAVLGITAGNTLEGLAGAYLLREIADFRSSLARVRDVVALVVLGGVVSTTISASIGATSLLAGDEISAAHFGVVWRTWWFGDMGGDLVVAPALLVAVRHWPFRRPPGRPLEAMALALVVLGLSALCFSRSTGLAYLAFPPLICAALRFWQPGAVGATLLMASVAIPLAAHDIGPFSGQPPDDRLLLTQTFLATAGITALILAAVITERARAEEDVEQIADTLQQSLLPSRLPEIPGMETAVDFRAAESGLLIGGDFYDLFELDEGAWAIVVGDVVGKGARAAATTALARYTLRAAAVREPSPGRMLDLLNDAILRQSPDQLCTAACGRLELGEGDGPARITIAIGGHPLPLVLRADGRVDTLGEHGALIGMLPDLELADYDYELSAGDALILYTDGLTDAYAPGRILKRAELLSALGSCAGRSAVGIAAGLHEAALGRRFTAPRDDIAVMVVRVPEREPARAAV